MSKPRARRMACDKHASGASNGYELSNAHLSGSFTHKPLTGLAKRKPLKDRSILTLKAAARKCCGTVRVTPQQVRISDVRNFSLG